MTRKATRDLIYSPLDNTTVVGADLSFYDPSIGNLTVCTYRVASGMGLSVNSITRVVRAEPPDLAKVLGTYPVLSTTPVERRNIPREPFAVPGESCVLVSISVALAFWWESAKRCNHLAKSLLLAIQKDPKVIGITDPKDILALDWLENQNRFYQKMQKVAQQPRPNNQKTHKVAQQKKATTPKTITQAQKPSRPQFKKTLNRSKEKDIQIQMQSIIGGKTEVLTPCGQIDLLTDTHLIEIKNANAWKSAIGQVLTYGTYYPSHIKIITLFGECDPKMRDMIESQYRNLGIILWWYNPQLKGTKLLRPDQTQESKYPSPQLSSR